MDSGGYKYIASVNDHPAAITFKAHSFYSGSIDWNALKSFDWVLPEARNSHSSTLRSQQLVKRPMVDCSTGALSDAPAF
jgi:hypothetical protein